MFDSKLETNEHGGKYLVCYYDRELKNWDEVIGLALNRHKLKVGECPVICLPMREKNGRKY